MSGQAICLDRQTACLCILETQVAYVSKILVLFWLAYLDVEALEGKCGMQHFKDQCVR